MHQQRPGVLFARGATLIGWPSADAAFDGEQGGDPLQGLQGDRRGCGMVHLVELSACVAPACNLDQRRLAIGRGWSVEPFEPGISIGMQKAPAGAKQCLRMDAHAIRRVVIERRRWHHRAPGPLVANDNPEPSGFGLSQAGREHRDGGVVGMQRGAGTNMPADHLSQRSEQELRLSDPIGQCGAVELDAFAGIDDGLAV